MSTYRGQRRAERRTFREWLRALLTWNWTITRDGYSFGPGRHTWPSQ